MVSVVQVSFPDLNIVIDVLFIVLQKDAPMLLFIRNMVESGLDISIQVQYMSLARDAIRWVWKTIFWCTEPIQTIRIMRFIPRRNCGHFIPMLLIPSWRHWKWFCCIQSFFHSVRKLLSVSRKFGKFTENVPTLYLLPEDSNILSPQKNSKSITDRKWTPCFWAFVPSSTWEMNLRTIAPPHLSTTSRLPKFGILSSKLWPFG